MSEQSIYISLISILLSTVELAVCAVATGLLLRQRKSREDGSRIVLAAGAAYCVMTSLLKYVSIFQSPTQNIYHEFLPISHSLHGVFAVLILLAYPLSVARPRWFSWQHTLLYFLPSIVPFAVFLCPEIHTIYSRQALSSLLIYPDVWLRLLMIPVTFIYCFGLLYLLARDGVRREGNWLRMFIYGAALMVVLVSTYMLTHYMLFHYVHQLYVAAFYAYFTWYELNRRTYIAPVLAHETEDTGDEGNERFLRFDRRIDEQRLFCDPTLNREQLCRLMGVDRNRFATIIQKHSGCKNMNDYINRKRIAYAITLMQQHPNYTFQAISEESGFSSVRTFHRIFHELHGCSPSEYQNRLN